MDGLVAMPRTRTVLGQQFTQPDVESLYRAVERRVSDENLDRPWLRIPLAGIAGMGCAAPGPDRVRSDVSEQHSEAVPGRFRIFLSDKSSSTPDDLKRKL